MYEHIITSAASRDMNISRVSVHDVSVHTGYVTFTAGILT